MSQEILPASIENEQALLGALMLNNDVMRGRAASLLRPEHFSEEIHRRIFDVAGTLIGKGSPATPVTILPFIGDQDLGGVSTKAYLANLFAHAPPPLIADGHAEIVLGLSERRQLIEVADSARAIALDPGAGKTTDDLIDKVEEDLAALRAGSGGITLTHGAAGTMAASLLKRNEEIRAGTIAAERLTSTGIPELDRDTGGFMSGALWVVAGRPGMGKTVVGTNLARAGAARGTGTTLFSLEVPERQIVARLLSDLAYRASAPLPFGSIMRGEYDDHDAERLRGATHRLDTMPLVIDCASKLSVSQIASRVRSERQRMGKRGVKLGLIVIDYLKFVSATDRYAGQRHYEVGEITRGLKQLAKDQDLCVVLLAQLNRAVEGRTDKRPDLADLRESGDIEADTDVVAFVYRDAYYIQRSPEYRRHDPEAVERCLNAQNKLELIIGKNRAGPLRTHELWIDVACSKISARELTEAF